MLILHNKKPFTESIHFTHKFDPRSYVLCFSYLNEIHTDKKANLEYGLSYDFLLQDIFSFLFVTDFTYNLLIPSCTSGSSG